jgi:5-methyltetrahydrofolate--homocysteine methyltransferase
LSDVTDLPIWFKPNAGLPQLDAEGHAIYSLLPEEMGDSAKSWPTKGARIIGGCCGTSAEHLQKIAESVR